MKSLKSVNSYILSLGFPKQKKQILKITLFSNGKILACEEIYNPIKSIEPNDIFISDKKRDEIGADIYQILFPGKVREKIEEILKRLDTGKIKNMSLNIQTDIPEIHNLPIESILHKNYRHLLLNENLSISHSFKTTEQLETPIEALPAPPLKILMVACAPDDQKNLLDYEKEQECILDAVDELTRENRVELDPTEEGSLEIMEEYLEKGQYNVLHLSGDGGFDKNGEPCFFMETPEGRTNIVSSEELAGILRKYQDHLRLVFLSACYSGVTRGQGETFGFAQALSSRGIPSVIGMRIKISDRAATVLAEKFYGSLVLDGDIEKAIARARLAVSEEEKRRLKNKEIKELPGEWAIPALFTREEQSIVINPKKKPVRHKKEKPIIILSGAEYLERGFVGRRRQIRQINRIIGERKNNIVLQGPGGIGKSTLATRVASRLRDQGYEIVTFRGDVNTEQVISLLAMTGENHLGRNIHGMVTKGDLGPIEKLGLILDNYLNQRPVCLLFDNFELNQDEASGEIKFSEIIEFLHYLEGNLRGKSLFLLTTRYRFHEPELNNIFLEEFSFPETWKKMDRLGNLRIQGIKEKREIYRDLGGNPRILVLLNGVIKEEKADLREIRKRYPEAKKIMERGKKEKFDGLFLGILWNHLDEKEKELLKVASLYRDPVPEDALLFHPDITLTRETKKRLIDLSLLTYQEEEKVAFYYVHRLTSSFVLSSPQTEGEIVKKSHQRAGEYFEEKVKESKESKDISEGLEARWHFIQAENYEKAAEIAFAAEDFLSLRGFKDAARELNLETLKLAGADKTKAIALHNLGILEKDRGDYDQALGKRVTSQLLIIHLKGVTGQSHFS